MNKKLIIMLLALGSVTSLKAQTEKGNQLLGGTIGLATGKQTTTSSAPYNVTDYSAKTTTFSIGPNYSYFIANKLDLGAAVGYTYQHIGVSTGAVSGDLEKVKNQSFSAQVYLRKYFLYDNKIGIRTGPFVDYGYGKTTNNVNGLSNIPNIPYYVPQTTNNVTGGVLLDFVYFPYKKLGLSSSLGSVNYSHSDTKQSDYGYKITNNTFGFNFFSNVNLSVFYAFGK